MLKFLIAQTMPAWEAFIVDDCSPGGRVDWIVAAYDDPRLHYIRHDTNRGAGAARNTGIQAGHAPFVLYIDGDDFVHPEFLATTLDAIDRQGADCAYSEFQLVGLSNELWAWEPKSANEIGEVQWIPGPGTVMRRRVWEQVGGYSAELYPNDDWDFWIGALELGFSVVRVPRPLYFYRRHARAGMFTMATSEWISREAMVKKRPEFFSVGNRAKKFRTGGLLSSAHANRIAGHRWQYIKLTARAISVDPSVLFPETKTAVRGLARKIKRKVRSITRRASQIQESQSDQKINLPPLDWDSLAPILHNRYGHLSHDFPVLAYVIDKTKARSVLEIGCGSGRLVPVYLVHDVQTIWLQDVSEQALQLCRERFFCQKHIRYFHGIVQSIPTSAAIDLVVTNRFLQHIMDDGDLNKMLHHLISVGRYFYINEADINEASSINWPYLKGRDYIRVFHDLGCQPVDQGELMADSGKQRWMLFRTERSADKSTSEQHLDAVDV